VVLAAGLSTRYGRLKQLDPLGPHGEAIMDYNVFDAVRAGFSRIVYVVRPEIDEQIRAHVTDLVGDAVNVRFIRQRLDEVPVGFVPPPERLRPWGTGHAVLCAAHDLEGVYAVCNADDLYGPHSFELLHRHLTGPVFSGASAGEAGSAARAAATAPCPSAGPADAALIGYTLADTLSGTGGVARGVCVLGRDGLLEAISEVREIRAVDGWISGVDEEGNHVELGGEEIVSMNLWGFTPPVTELLDLQFARFLDRTGGDPEAEFLLSTALNDQVRMGRTRVAVRHSPDAWFGVTHAQDRALAEATLKRRIEDGAYPADLAAAFRSLS